MDSKEIIRRECEKNRQRIADAETSLKLLQKTCKHEETFEGQWSWRIGSTLPATICSICGGLVKLNLPNIEPEDERSVARKA